MYDKEFHESRGKKGLSFFNFLSIFSAEDFYCARPLIREKKNLEKRSNLLTSSYNRLRVQNLPDCVDLLAML